MLCPFTMLVVLWELSPYLSRYWSEIAFLAASIYRADTSFIDPVTLLREGMICFMLFSLASWPLSRHHEVLFSGLRSIALEACCHICPSDRDSVGANRLVRTQQRDGIRRLLSTNVRQHGESIDRQCEEYLPQLPSLHHIQPAIRACH